ncbi:MAG: EAL domain-containing protein [Rhodocyclaceae bacterium]|nr:EAL domain-containing protein [Rhodocyclaceae bacterium]
MRCVRHRSDEFRLHLRPQIDIASGSGGGGRGADPLAKPAPMGLVPAGHVHSAGGRVGLIEGIGRWVLEQAGRNGTAGGGRLSWASVAVNLSMRQLRKRDIVAIVRRVLQDNRIAPGQLEPEVTETVTMEAPETTIGVLGQLRALGVLLSVDDLASPFRRSPG